MSKTVDERVVSMQFDNRHFERNAQTTLSTLDKLKQKLNFSNTAKGLESLGDASKKVNLNPLAQSVEAVQMKFSALQVVGITTLQNLTNSAVNAGKKMVSALTIDPVKTGFSEYETKMNSIQTIMSNTASKGTTMEDVIRVIDELNEYADQTIYNFTEMTRNIGTFTAAGVGLEESAAAIKGIANLAAASGSNSQQASTAMYQLSQALSTGVVKLMDWNSVVNAGMGGELFQNAIKETARAHGVAVDAIIEKNGSFRDSLQDGWFTADILTETLKKMTKSGVAEYLSELTGVSQEQIAAAQKLVDENKDGKATYDELAETLAKTGKVTKEQAIEMLKGADNAEDAATKVKTFTQLIDTLKESLQSGWGKTWELLIGNFDQAKELFTGISDVIGGFIDKTSKIRNDIIEKAMGSPFGKLAEKLNSVTTATEKVTEATKDYNDIVNKVIQGEFGNGQTRWDKLAEAGYDWAHVQNLVNEKLGDSTRHATNYVEAQNGVNESQSKTIEQLMEMSDAQLRDLDFKEDEIEALRELEQQSIKTGIPVEELLKDTSLLSGRSLLINSFKNAGQGLLGVFESLRDAWAEIFPPKSIDERAAKIYDLISALHGFSTKLKMSTDTADKLKRTFKGVFALIDILTTILGGGFKIAFKVISSILGYFNLDLLSLTAIIGDALVKFRDWFDSLFDLTKILDKVVPWIKSAASAIGEWFSALGNTNAFSDFVSLLKGAAGSIREWFDGLKEADNIPKYIIEGLANGLSAGIKTVIGLVANIGRIILDKIKEVLGIHSPSTEFFKIAWFCIMGLVKGFFAALSVLWNTINILASNILKYLQKVDIGSLLAVIISSSALRTVSKIADAISAFASPFDELGGVLKKVGKVVKSFSKVMNSFSLNLKAKALKELAIGIAILAGAVIALTLFYDDDMIKAVGILVALAAVLAILAFAINKISTASMLAGKDSLSVVGLGATLVALATSLLLMAVVVKILGNLDPEQAKKGFLGLTGLILSIAMVIGTYGLTVKGKGAQNIKAFGKMIRSLAITLLLLVGVVKLISLLEYKEMLKGVAFTGVFLLFIYALSKLGQMKSQGLNKIGGLMLKVAGAMLLLVLVCKLTTILDKEAALKGAAFAGAFLVFLLFLQLIGMIPSHGFNKLGSTLLAISAAMMLMALTVKMVGNIETDKLVKGIQGVGLLLTFIIVLMYVIDLMGPNAPKIGATMLAISVAVGVLAGIAILLGLIDGKKLAKGITAVGFLALFMAGLIVATNWSKDFKDNLIAMTVAIGLLAVAVIALTFIDPTKLANATVALMSLMGMFAILIASTDKAGGEFKTLVTLAAMIAVFGIVLAVLANMPLAGTLVAMVSLSVLMLVMAGVLAILGALGEDIGKAEKAIKGMLTLAGVLAILALSLSLLANMPLLGTIAATVMLSTLMLIMVGVLAMLGALDSTIEKAQNGLKGMLALAGILVLLTLSLALLSNVNHVIGSAIALSALLVIMTSVLLLLGAIEPVVRNAVKGAVGLALLAVPLLAISFALKNLSGVENVVGSAIALAALLAVMSGVLLLLCGIGPQATKAIPGIAALIVLAGSLFVLGAALKFIGGMSWKELAVGLIAIAGAFLIMGIAGAALGFLAPMILMLSSAFVLIGIGTIAAGIGLTLVAVGIAALANALDAGAEKIINGLTVILNGMITLIPLAIQVIGTAITEFCSMIIQVAPMIAMAITTVLVTIVVMITQFAPVLVSCIVTILTLLATNVIPKLVQFAVTMITSFLDAIIVLVPKVTETAVVIITALLDALMECIPKIVEAGLKILISILKGIGDNIAEIVKMAAYVITEFLRGLSESLPDIIQAAFELIISFINGLADAIRDNNPSLVDAVNNLMDAIVGAIKEWFENFKEKGGELAGKIGDGLSSKIEDLKEKAGELMTKAVEKIGEFYEDFKSAGKDVVDGLKEGISSKIESVGKKASELGSKALGGIKSALGIASPSKEFAKVGKYSGEGLIKGFESYRSNVVSTASSIGSSALDTVRSTLSNLGSVIGSDIDSQPTIRPVLDLSDVSSGVGLMNDMFDMSPSVGVMSSIRSISSSMSNRSQNGGNNDVISALKDLKDSISKSSGNTYSINGVTYDDGSNVADAVQSLIRAAKIERRM